nr:MAG TPA: hypothetical protein [Caudoviricetes sp.]
MDVRKMRQNVLHPVLFELSPRVLERQQEVHRRCLREVLRRSGR